MLRVSSWVAGACLATAALVGLCLSQVPALGGGGDQPLTLQISDAGADGSDGPQVVVGQIGTASTPNQQQPTPPPAPSGQSKPAEKEKPKEPEYRTQVAKKIAEKLDADVSIELKTTLDSLADVLSEQLGVPVLADARAIEQAGLKPSQTSVTFTSDRQPLRSSLRRFLQPLGLRAEVQDEGLVITADFAELTRRGILTDKWVGLSDEFIARVDEVLATEVALPQEQIPLDRAIAEFSRAVDFPMVIIAVALEGIGLTVDTPVRGHMRGTTSEQANVRKRRIRSDAFARDPDKKVTPAENPLAEDESDDAKAETPDKDSLVQNLPLGTALDFLLQDLELTYTVRDGMITVTTRDDADTRLLPRLYFLEGTGLLRGDFGSAMSIIQTTIEPDSWEALGGVGTMAPIGNGVSARPALLVSTTFDVHQQIADLLQSLRESHVGPDPVGTGRPPNPIMPQGAVGGFGGGFGGGMGGGMGGMGGGGGGVF